jgi:acyl-CoA synthetase (NDP forming)
LKKRLPPYASFGNPIDMTANVIFDPALMAATGARRRAERRIRRGDALRQPDLAAGARRSRTSSRRLADAAGGLVGVAWIAGKPEPLARLKRAGVPVFTDRFVCAKAIAAGCDGRRSGTRVPEAGARRLPPTQAAPQRSWHLLARRRRWLRKHGIEAAPSGGWATDADQAKRMRPRLGYPVAAKLVARNLAHKSEIGGVRIWTSIRMTRSAAPSPRSTRCRSRQGGNSDPEDGRRRRSRSSSG